MATGKVLIVEDDAELRSVLSRSLREEGFEVDTVATGGDVLARTEKGLPDIFVIDIGLPDADGRDVCQALRARGIEKPVLFLTARDAVVDRVAGFDAGGDDYVAKPFALVELVARVRAQLRQSHWSGDPTIVTAGTLMLDLARRQAKMGALVTDLSDREFRLLHHFVLHAGEVLSRERLLAEVWGYSFDPGSNVVEVCVRRLRKKLGPEAPIETVRHAGYRLVAA